MRKFTIAAGIVGGVGIEIVFFSLQGLEISLHPLVWWTGVALGGVLILGSSLVALFWPRPKGGAGPPKQPRPPRRRIINRKAEPGLIRADIEDEQPRGGAVVREGGQTTEATSTSTTPSDLLSDIDMETGDEVRVRDSVSGPTRRLSVREKALADIYRWLVRQIVRMTR